MSKRKTKITDADIIDVIINYRTEEEAQKRAELEARQKKVKERYKAALLNLLRTSPRGRALLKVFPEATANRLSSWRGYRIHVFNRHSEDERSDEMSAEIHVKPNVAKRVKKMEDEIEAIGHLIEAHKPSPRIAWKRQVLTDVLKAYPDGKKVFRRIIEQAAKRAYQALPLGRHPNAVQKVTGVPQPKKTKRGRND